MTVESSNTGSISIAYSIAGGTALSSGIGSVVIGMANGGAINLQATAQAAVAIGEDVEATAANAIIFGKLASNAQANTVKFGFQETIAGAVTDGFTAALLLDPEIVASSAQTVTRHNYIDVQQPALTNVTVTDACVFRFDANVGTHLALASPGAVGVTLLGTGPTGANAGNPLGWIKINVNGTKRFIPYW
jgi:hypothetical protein